MPFQSESQRRFMYAKHPKLAKEFQAATPENADLPEHVKKHENMADGGVADSTEPIKPEEKMPDLESGAEAFEQGMDTYNVRHDSDAVKSYLASKFHQLLHPGAEPGKMAEGGYPHVTFLENETPEKVQETVHLEPKKPMPTTMTGTGENMAHGGVSHEEKLNTIYKTLGMKGYAAGGPVIPAGPIAGAMPNPQDPTYWEQVKAALAKLTSPMGAAMAPAASAGETVAPIVASAAPEAVSAVNRLTGASLPVPPPSAPKTEDLGTPVPLSASVPPIAKPPVVPPAMSPTAGGAGAPDLKNLFNQDTSKLTEGVEAGDRQALAGKTEGQQRGLGSIVAEALAGLGDALAAKGGREQHSLKDIFSMQKQQRDEALANFDRARQDRIEKLDIQTKMGSNAIQQLAAQDAYGVDEHLNKQLGAPPGTLHKDLPLYMQLATAQLSQNEKDSDLYMKAHKQAADEVEASIKNAGIFNVKPSPEQIKAAGAKLADTYYNRAKGNILFQPSDGQKPVWIPAKNQQKAKQMDPNGQIIP